MLKRVVSTWTATGCVQFSGGNVFARPGSKREAASLGLMSASTGCGHWIARAYARECPTAVIQPSSFDDFVSARQERQRHSETKAPRCLKIDCELDFGRL